MHCLKERSYSILARISYTILSPNFNFHSSIQPEYRSICHCYSSISLNSFRLNELHDLPVVYLSSTEPPALLEGQLPNPSLDIVLSNVPIRSITIHHRLRVPSSMNLHVPPDELSQTLRSAASLSAADHQKLAPQPVTGPVELLLPPGQRETPYTYVYAYTYTYKANTIHTRALIPRSPLSRRSRASWSPEGPGT